MLNSYTMKETGNRGLKELIRLNVSRETSSSIQMPWKNGLDMALLVAKIRK